MTVDQLAIDALRAAQASAGHAWASAWAAWVLGGIGLVVNLAAVVLVGFQLLANREAIKAASDSAKAASDAANAAMNEARPWIELSVPNRARLNIAEDGKVTCTMLVGMTNIGRTPALRADVRLDLIIGNRGSGGIGQAAVAEAYEAAVRRGSSLGKIIFPSRELKSGPEHRLEVDLTDCTKVFSILVVTCTYRDHSGTAWKATPAVRFVRQDGEHASVFQNAVGSIDVSLAYAFDFDLDPR